MDEAAELIRSLREQLEPFVECAKLITEEWDDNEHVADFPIPGRSDGAFRALHVSDFRALLPSPPALAVETET